MPKQVMFIGGPNDNRGRTPGAWVVGKIYDLDPVIHGEDSKPDGSFFYVKEDSRGAMNGWKAEYFQVIQDQKEKEVEKDQISDRIGDMHAILSFLFFLRIDKPGTIYGGVRVEEAYQSLLRILNLTEEKVNKVFEWYN